MTRPIRVLELRSVRGTGGGPEKTILLGTARTDSRRFAITICYLRDARDSVFGIDAAAAGLPVDYTEIIEKHSFDPTIWPKLRRLVRERSIDIVHAHDYKTDVLAWLLGQCEPIVPLSTVHGWTGHSRRERWGYYPLDKRVLSRFPKLIAVSTDVRRELIRHGASPDRVVTVLNGIDHRAFRRDVSRERVARENLGLPTDRFVIGAVGRLEPQKRFDLLIDAFAAIRAAHPTAILVIAGDGSLRESLRAHAQARRLGDACRFLGHRSDVGALHHAFDLFVQSSDYEGTPNAVLEAMALCTPVVATDVGGTAEIARAGVDALIVPAGRAEPIAAGIQAVLDDRAAAGARVDSARQRVERVLSFEARMRAVEEIYVELAAHRIGNVRRPDGRADTVRRASPSDAVLQ
jgi:glycosyltransferase involved in cell wall biosynthesis